MDEISIPRLFPIAMMLLAMATPTRSQGGHKQTASAENYRTWQVYGGGPDNIHYSSLNQINRDNVSQLKVAWRYDSGDEFPQSEMECNPIIIRDVLYATTPRLRLIALNAATGKLIWTFMPPEGKPLQKMRNRGVTYMDLIIMGTIAPEDLPSAPGDIRAYDVRTGKMRWIFHTIPHPGEFGYNTWPKDAWKYSGGANNWGGMSVDMKRGLVFVPTGSAAFDFYGADRLGDDLFANCLLALNAETGKLVWYFQGVRHDLWDRDFPAAPALITVSRSGRQVDAIAQITKSGYVFVFDRENGKPLFPIEYRKTPPSDVDGEKAAAMQPFPLLPPPFARQEFTPAVVTDRTPAAHEAVLARLKKLRYGGQFIPPSRQGTVIFPGFDGGGEWGGPAFDPATGVLYVNANEMAWILRIVPRPKTRGRVNGRELYLSNCSSCHRADLRG